MKCIPVKEAIGLVLCHDITEIVPGTYKGPSFLRGHVVQPQDITHLLRLGKEHLYVWDTRDTTRVHEDEAATRIAQAVAGSGVVFGSPREGRINFTADCQGLLSIDTKLLERINSIPDVTLATAHTLQEVTKGRMIAGTRVIPLTVSEKKLTAVESCCQNTPPLLQILPFAAHRVGIITTGSEVYQGRIKDAFGPVLRKKFAAWGSTIHSQDSVPDDPKQTATAIVQALESGATLIAVTGGMSVDPDDKTPAAIRSVCDEIVTYGAPVFPGAMFMLGYKANIPVLGLPGCVMYHRASIFDILLPRILAGLQVTKKDIIRLGHGGLCESCPECHYPACAFGKA